MRTIAELVLAAVMLASCAGPRTGEPTRIEGRFHPDAIRTEGNAQLYIPQAVRTIWVFLQDSVDDMDCTKIARVDRDEFIARFEEFRNEARRANKKLIVTAISKNEGQWINGEIKVNGKKLLPAEYTCNGTTEDGSEVPL